MKKEHLHLLIVLKSSDNLNGMRKYGYEYDEILTFLKELIAKEYVLRTNETIELTKSGYNKLKEFDESQKEVNSSGMSSWILPDYKNKLKRKSSISVPFIPNSKSLKRIIQKVQENL
ncbi:hypothetical protein [Algibacter sp. R77976]|uniref:hypothetical protein n=1 Tax=Algibacter sp. R77976 TaxID=3093873 RepID=UPI0037C6C66E